MTEVNENLEVRTIENQPETNLKQDFPEGLLQEVSNNETEVPSHQELLEQKNKIMKSWTDDDVLKSLAQKQRFSEVVTGVIRGLREMEFPVAGGGTRYIEVLTVALPEGVTGYCPVSDFSSVKFKSHVRFVGRTHNFVIESLNLNNSVALLSGTKAETIGVQKFWNQIEEDEDEGNVTERTYSATVTGRNDSKQVIFVDVEGQVGYLYHSDWAWERGDTLPDNGTITNVRIASYDKDEQVVRFNRKILLANPFEYVSTLMPGDIVAGKVQDVHAIHGIYVELENGVSLKASVVRALPNPAVGDMVTCSVTEIKESERGGYRGRVRIIGYPRGKKRAKDLGQFLFS